MVNPRGRCTHAPLTRRFLGGVIRIGRRHTSSIEKKIGKEFMYEDWLHCLHRGRFKTRFEIRKNEEGELSDIRAIRRHSAEIVLPSRLKNYMMFHHKGEVTHGRVRHTKKKVTHRKEVHTLNRRRVHILCCRMWVKHEINISLQKLNWWQKEMSVKKKIIKSSSPTTMQTKQKNLQISRNRGRWLWKSKQNAEHWIHLSATRERILADSVYAIITYQSMLKEYVVQVVNESGDENCSQDNLCIERK